MTYNFDDVDIIYINNYLSLLDQMNDKSLSQLAKIKLLTSEDYKNTCNKINEILLSISESHKVQ